MARLVAAISTRRRRRSTTRRAISDRLDKKLAQEEVWLRQGVKARRTRNEGRVKALMKLRAERAARRMQSARRGWQVDTAEKTGKLVFEAEGGVEALAATPVIADYLAADPPRPSRRTDRPERRGQDDAARLLVGELEPDEGEIRRGTQPAGRLLRSAARAARSRATVADTVNDGNDTVTGNASAIPQ